MSTLASELVNAAGYNEMSKLMLIRIYSRIIPWKCLEAWNGRFHRAAILAGNVLDLEVLMGDLPNLNYLNSKDTV